MTQRHRQHKQYMSEAWLYCCSGAARAPLSYLLKYMFESNCLLWIYTFKLNTKEILENNRFCTAYMYHLLHYNKTYCTRTQAKEYLNLNIKSQWSSSSMFTWKLASIVQGRIKKPIVRVKKKQIFKHITQWHHCKFIQNFNIFKKYQMRLISRCRYFYNTNDRVYSLIGNLSLYISHSKISSSLRTILTLN